MATRARTTGRWLDDARSEHSPSRLLGAAGFDLEITMRACRDGPTTLASLVNAVEQGEDGLRVDWTRLRAFADWCRQHPDEVAGAIADAPRRTEIAFDAVLAGFAELLADAVGIEAPAWTRSVPYRLNRGGRPAPRRCWPGPRRARRPPSGAATSSSGLMRSSVSQGRPRPDLDTLRGELEAQRRRGRAAGGGVPTHRAGRVSTVPVTVSKTDRATCDRTWRLAGPKLAAAISLR